MLSSIGIEKKRKIDQREEEVVNYLLREHCMSCARLQNGTDDTYPDAYVRETFNSN